MRARPSRTRSRFRDRADNRLVAAAVAVGGVGGAVTALGFPPVDAWLLAPVGLSLTLAAFRLAPRPVAGALVALAAGLGTFGTLLSWSLRFGAVAYVALTLSQAAFLLPVGWVSSRLAAGSAIQWVAGTAAAWTLAEALRARWPLGGFEWGQVGYVWHDAPLRGVAGLLGVLGLTALTVLAAAGAVGLLALSRPRLPGALLAAAAVLLAAPQPSWTSAVGSLDVAVVQTAPVCPGPAVDCPNAGGEVFDRQLRATRRLDQPVDLVVWGEGALRASTPMVGGQRLVAEGDPLPAPLLAGVVSPAGRGRFSNRNILYTQTGRVAGTYAKRHPVPFGEYVPLRRLLGGIGEVGRLVPSDMVVGDQPGLVHVRDVTLSTVSSWELSFAREVRASGADGQAVTALTTETSYGRSAVSDQLLAMAQLRAVETGRAVLVAATTGRSALITADGTRVAVTPLLAPAVLRVELPLHQGTTPYGSWGDTPVVAMAALAFLMTSARRVTPGDRLLQDVVRAGQR